MNLVGVSLSDYQLEIIKRISQVFKPHTLIKLYGEEEGLKYYKKYTVNEIISQLGKGSGKDFTSRVSFCYILYLLHCLNDPIKYYKKSPGDYIDLLNVAVNADQAHNVFFQPLKGMLANSPYFEGLYEPHRLDIQFWERPVRAFSGHSESEGWEGYNLLVVILDEISAFKTDMELKGETRTRHSASAIYKMSRRSVSSRFPDVGKVVLLSFPRFASDFITTRYDDVVNDKEVIPRHAVLKVHDDLPDEPSNQLRIEWEEDHILSYKVPKVWAIKRPTWEVNPTINLQDLVAEFLDDEVDSLARFACVPPMMEDAFFRNVEAVEAAFPHREPPINSDGSFKPGFNGDDGHPRFIHVDLAARFDRAAVAMVHSPGLINVTYKNDSELLPKIVVDCVQYWEAPKNGEIDFADIRKFVFDLQSAGFTIAKLTSDEWQSTMMMQEFKSRNISTDKVIIKKVHYDNLAYAIYDGRLHGYHQRILIDELLRLKLIRGDKVDHPSTGSKDLADALCGAVWNCTQYTRYDTALGVDIRVLGEEVKKQALPTTNKIEVVKQPMPPEIADWLESMKMI